MSAKLRCLLNTDFTVFQGKSVALTGFLVLLLNPLLGLDASVNHYLTVALDHSITSFRLVIAHPIIIIMMVLWSQTHHDFTTATDQH